MGNLEDIGIHDEVPEDNLFRDDSLIGAVRQKAAKKVAEDVEQKILGNPPRSCGSDPIGHALPLGGEPIIRQGIPKDGECLAELKIDTRTFADIHTFSGIRHHTGSKYVREIVDCVNPGMVCFVDVYAVLEAFQVTCPARAHAIKKLLCAGLRGKGSQVNDLIETRDAVSRAIEMQTAKELRSAAEPKT